ncbi:MAG: hypothetical protein ACPH0A_08225, partial [Candidatus Poseidoniaceae archaeon]
YYVTSQANGLGTFSLVKGIDGTISSTGTNVNYLAQVRAIRQINTGVRPSDSSSTSVTISGSLDVRDGITGSIDYSNLTNVPQGLVSGSTQVIDSLPSGVVSGSSQITITESQISDLSHTDISSLNTFTSSIQDEVDLLTAATSSYLTSIDSGIVSSSAQVTELLPSGVISGSSQLPSGLVSGSSQITITESQISDLTHYSDSDVKTKLDAEGVISGSTQITDGSGIVSSSVQVIGHLPDGVISGSTQITDGSGIVSSSTQVIEHLPSGTISGSTQITDGSGLVSSSAQVIQHLPEGVISGSTYTEFSSSVSESIDALQIFSSSAYQSDSSSIDRRLDG